MSNLTNKQAQFYVSCITQKMKCLQCDLPISFVIKITCQRMGPEPCPDRFCLFQVQVQN